MLSLLNAIYALATNEGELVATKAKRCSVEAKAVRLRRCATCAFNNRCARDEKPIGLSIVIFSIEFEIGSQIF